MSGSDLLMVSHAATRTGAPAVTLALLRHLRRSGLDVSSIALAGGGLEGDFRAEGGRVLGATGSRGWMIERGLAQLGFGRAAAVAATARHLPRFAGQRPAAVYLGSAAAGFALTFVRGGPVPVITHVHELDYVLGAAVSAEMWQRLLDATTVWVVPTGAVAEAIATHGVDRARIVVQPEFVEVPTPSPGAASAVRSRLGIASDVPLIAAMGTTDWRKGPDLFLRVAAVVDRRWPTSDSPRPQFVWVGGASPGPDLRHLLHDVEHLGLGDRVRFVGEVDDPADWLAAADVLCVTSREDPLPLAAVEAAFVMTPVVAFATGGLAEVAADGDIPRFAIVPPLDVEAMAAEVLRLFADPTAARAMARAAHDWAASTCDVAVAGSSLHDELCRRIPQLRPRPR